MKRFYGTILLIVIIFTQSALAKQENSLHKIKNAIQIGSAKEVINLLHNNSEINIENKIIKGRNNETEILLKKFFHDNPSIEMDLIHEGETNNKITYILANYKTINDNFKIIVFVKKISENSKIDRLIINKEK